LQKCILLGGQVGSERLRDWARRELKGYDREDEIPEYRRFRAALCIDGVTIRSVVRGQPISAGELPDFARGKITEDVALGMALGELEDLSRGAEDIVRLQPPLAQELVRLWNHQRQQQGYDQITSLYWMISRSTITGVVSGVRTALNELVGELIATMPDDNESPTKQTVDAAVGFVVTGGRHTFVVGDQSSTVSGPVIGGNADGARMAWGNRDVDQSQTDTQQVVAPGFESVAEAIARLLEGLPTAGLPEQDQQDVQAAAEDVLAEVNEPEPDRGKVRRLLASVRGLLTPIATKVATEIATGAGQGAEEWARTAIEHLPTHF
jgi:hypothetical protein